MLLPKQIWKDIPGYEGKYQVSNTGKVRSLNYMHTGKTKILKQNTDKDGYKRVLLCKNSKVKAYTVHRLVAQAFIPNENNLPCINHIDENKANNVVWNLEWCTHKYNCNYGTRNEKLSESNKGKQLTEEHKNKISKAKKGENNPMYGKKSKDCPNSKPVLMFTKNGEFIKRFDCVKDANEYLGKGRNNTNISMCASGINKGESKTAYGYIWKYEEDCK